MVTICILTTKHPEKVLECLRNQTYQDFEVIVANESPIPLAFNRALARAKGEIFIRLDDDVEMPIDWLSNLVEPFAHRRIAGVTGPTFVPPELRQNRDSIRIWESPNWFLRWLRDNTTFAPAAIFKSGMVSYDSNYPEMFFGGEDGFEPDHLEGTNWAMRTELIRKVGGFDPKFDGVSEWIDTDVEQKIKKLGYRLWYNPSAYLWHLLEKGEHYNDRFDAIGRIKNWLRFHFRHSRFHYKMPVYLVVWVAYFLMKAVKK